MHGDVLEHTVTATAHPGLTLENPYCVRGAVDGELLARQGAMVAHRGEVTFAVARQGLRKLVKRTVTREGLTLMTIGGRGDVWLADQAKNAFVVALDDEAGLAISGKSVLCFEAALGYEIRRVKGAGMAGGGLFNCVFAGSGALAITTHGEPLVIGVTPDTPVLVDTDAVIGWTATLETSIHKAQSWSSLLRGGSGEAYQLTLRGEGSVIVQPSEGPLVPKSGDGVVDTVADMIG